MRRYTIILALILAACSGGRSDAPVTSSHGKVCGDSAIRGEVVGQVPGRIAQCGVNRAVRVHQINGVTLSRASVMECDTARTLKRWMGQDMTPIVGNRGGGVTGLRVAAHYACRTRNSQPDARVSEHAKGRAIDIAAFQLRDGSEISVEDHWGRGRNGRILRRLHQSACGPFGTVLGPESDRWHQDHFHFDTARYRSGAYCR